VFGSRVLPFQWCPDVPPKREVQFGQTADLGVVTLVAPRALLDDVFGVEMTDHAWGHAQGGVHALIWDAGQLVGHGAVVARQLRHRRRLLRAGYIEAVGVRVDAHRRGHGAAIMEVLERIVRDGYDLGAVGASQAGAGSLRESGLDTLARPNMGANVNRPDPDCGGRRGCLCPRGQGGVGPIGGSDLRLA
jgi:hypothetical protein